MFNRGLSTCRQVNSFLNGVHHYVKRSSVALVLLFIFLAIVVAWESFALSVEYVDIPIAGLPPEFDGFRIVQISDLHGRRIAPAGREVRIIREAEPDMIAVTGDFVEHSASEVHSTLPFFRELTGIAPVYAVSGNHDHWTDWPYISGQLRETGVTVLENEHVLLFQSSTKIILAGVNDPYTGHGDLTQALPGEVNTPVVLLAHAPTWFLPDYSYDTPVQTDAARQRELLEQVSLTLVGHTHGGQIKLPLIGAVTNASGTLFPRTHVEGLSREDRGGWLYINRGLGNVFLPIRFLSRAEITVLTLRSP